MSPLIALSVAIAVSLVLSTIVAIVMTEPLRGVLKQLCLNSDAGTFWIPFTTVMFYVTPLLFTVLFESTVVPLDFVGIVRTALASSLFGAFAALLVVGYQISISRARPSAR
jgi:hypothetical protein